MEDKKPTHILQTYKQQHATLLFRASDKILCGMQQNAVVVMGDNPHKKTSHTFLSAEDAAIWLRTVFAERDAKELGFEAAFLHEIDGEHQGIVLPETAEIELPGMGAYNPMRKFN